MLLAFYNKVGQEIDKPDTENNQHKVLAKKMTGNEISRYWVAYSNGMPVEVKKLSDGELRKVNSKMTEVPESVFVKYMKYLRSESLRMSVSNIRND
jgi:hypothetical protein